MTTSIDQLNRWLSEPEGTRLEFKEAKNRFDFDKLVEYCVALANEGGGKIILGVTDKRPRKIVGTQAFNEPGRTEAGLYERLMHRIPVEELTHPEGRLIVVHVPGRLRGTAWEINGCYLKRAGDGLAALSAQELKEIFDEAGPDFSAEICLDSSISDLIPEAIADFRLRWSRKTGDSKKLSWSDIETLTNAELLINGKCTYAALILFGSYSALGRYLAQAEVVFEYRSSEASGPAAERKEYREGFFSWYDAIWAKINLRNDRQSYQDGLFRYEVPTFDEIQVRESLLNAIAHRDYRLGGSIFIRQFPQRLEVVSPGGFPAGITTQNVLDQQNPRNRRLAEALARSGLIERAGQGMNLMFERAIRFSKPLPDFAGTDSHEVRLALKGQIGNPAFLRFLEKLGEETLASFSTYDFLALDHIHRDLPLDEALKSRLPLLIDVGAIERSGKGKYFLSQRLYESIGAKGVYTRKRGLDRNTNKALLLKHIERNNAKGSKMEEFLQVLPSLKRSEIQSLLRSMIKEDAVHKTGKTRGASWFIGPATDKPTDEA
jgi:ATP-dependent DNA helicase RecG